MLKDRSLLEGRLVKIFMSMGNRKPKNKPIYDYLEKEFKIPLGVSFDYIAGTKDLSEATLNMLYCITKAAQENTGIKLINQFFTQSEIKEFDKYEYHKESVDDIFPIRLKMVEITEDQWIGKINSKELMVLRELQLINYNRNTQRALKKVSDKTGNENYIISIAQKAVTSILNLFSESRFIPNTITLNIQEDDENADFFYDKKKSELVIKNVSCLDITDGYHRYLALARCSDVDSDFDYPMELRVTNFSESKANQFIFQEDQKTKMKKIYSSSKNQYDIGNIICKRLNESVEFNLCGNVGISGQNIDAAKLSLLINKIYIPKKKYKEKNERKLIIQVTKDLTDGINSFTEKYPDYLEKSWSDVDISVVLYGLANNMDCNKIKSVIDTVNKDEVFQQGNGREGIKKAFLDSIEEVFKNV